MRALNRNASPVWFANPVDTDTMLTDHKGYYSGEYGVVYGNPVEIRANVSPARNVTHFAFFGVDVAYDKTLTMCDPLVPITENTVFWINTEPVLNTDGSTDTPYDYTVNKVAKWKNSLVVAVQEVKVSA